MQTVKNLQELRDAIQEIKWETMENFIVGRLHDSDRFDRGEIQGFIRALEEIDDILRCSLKYQEDIES